MDYTAQQQLIKALLAFTPLLPQVNVVKVENNPNFNKYMGTPAWTHNIELHADLFNKLQHSIENKSTPYNLLKIFFQCFSFGPIYADIYQNLFTDRYDVQRFICRYLILLASTNQDTVKHVLNGENAVEQYEKMISDTRNASNTASQYKYDLGEETNIWILQVTNGDFKCQFHFPTQAAIVSAVACNAR